jgi:hypothetical protein
MPVSYREAKPALADNQEASYRALAEDLRRAA